VYEWRWVNRPDALPDAEPPATKHSREKRTEEYRGLITRKSYDYLTM